MTAMAPAIAALTAWLMSPMTTGSGRIGTHSLHCPSWAGSGLWEPGWAHRRPIVPVPRGAV